MSAFDPVDARFEKGFSVRKQAGAKTASLDSRRAGSGPDSGPASGGIRQILCRRKGKNMITYCVMVRWTLKTSAANPEWPSGSEDLLLQLKASHAH